jgi:hypothetical protein
MLDMLPRCSSIPSLSSLSPFRQIKRSPGRSTSTTVLDCPGITSSSLSSSGLLVGPVQDFPWKTGMKYLAGRSLYAFPPKDGRCSERTTSCFESLDSTYLLPKDGDKEENKQFAVNRDVVARRFSMNRHPKVPNRMKANGDQPALRISSTRRRHRVTRKERPRLLSQERYSSQPPSKTGISPKRGTGKRSMPGFGKASEEAILTPGAVKRRTDDFQPAIRLRRVGRQTATIYPTVLIPGPSSSPRG